MNTKSPNPQPETANTLAGHQRGLTRLIGPLLAMTLVALPISWHLPLFRTELLVFLENEVTLLGAVITLAETDLFLCAIVVLFGMAIPFMKLLALLYAWFALPQARAQSWINAIGKISKFSMLDVMLIAIVIVGLKGVGMGKVKVEYGLYAYALVVIFALLLSSWMQVVAGRRVTAAVAQS
jgi:paraquat-inducible protein A